MNMGNQLVNTTKTDIDINKLSFSNIVTKVEHGETLRLKFRNGNSSCTLGIKIVQTGCQNVDTNKGTCITKLRPTKRARTNVSLDEDEIKSKKKNLDNDDQETLHDDGPVDNTRHQLKSEYEATERTDATFYKKEDDNCEVKGYKGQFDKNKNITTGSITSAEQESTKYRCANGDIQVEVDNKAILVSKAAGRSEAATIPKLYRLLRDGENVSNGLTAKNPRARVAVAIHVATGSNGAASKFISTCASLSAAENLRSLKNRSRYRNGKKDIVEIDVGQLPMSVNIIDLTTEEKRKKHETWNTEINEKFHRFASSHQEVLLVGKVPPECLRLIPFT